MIAVMMLVSTAMFAEKGDTWVGVNANYGMHSDYKNFGVGVKAQWEFMDNIRLEPSFNYYFKKDYLSMYDLNLNVQYLIPVGGVKIYPLAGVTLLGEKVSYGGFSSSNSDIGLNLGAGVEFPLTDVLKLNIEGKYQIVKDWNRPVISVGVAYAF